MGQPQQRHHRPAAIPPAVFYRVPLHRHPAFASVVTGEEELPVSEMLSRQVLSLPIGPDITDAECERVIGALLDALHLQGGRPHLIQPRRLRAVPATRHSRSLGSYPHDPKLR